jgi:hypothetical protein
VVDGSHFRSALSAQLFHGLLFLALDGRRDMGVIRTILAISIFVLCAGSARADWQFTSWGMSEAELTAISENIEPTTAAEKQARSSSALPFTSLVTPQWTSNLPLTTCSMRESWLRSP